MIKVNLATYTPGTKKLEITFAIDTNWAVLVNVIVVQTCNHKLIL